MKRRSEKLATGLGSSVINVVAGRNNIVAGACAKRVHGPCDQVSCKGGLARRLRQSTRQSNFVTSTARLF